MYVEALAANFSCTQQPAASTRRVSQDGVDVILESNRRRKMFGKVI